MDSKRSLLSRLIGKKRGCCCQVKIEEIPEDESGTSPGSAKPGQCCGGEDDGKRDSNR
ncbi:MAG: hypothetical protein ACM3X4_07920 [Ignavibacteriales bacterium]